MDNEEEKLNKTPEIKESPTAPAEPATSTEPTESTQPDIPEPPTEEEPKLETSENASEPAAEGPTVEESTIEEPETQPKEQPVPEEPETPSPQPEETPAPEVPEPPVAAPAPEPENVEPETPQGEPLVEQNTEQTEEPTPKKSNKGFLFAIILLAVAAIFSILALLFYKETPETILSSAIDNFENAGNVSFVSSSEFEFKDPEASGAKSAELIFSASSLTAPADASLFVNIVTPDDDEIFTTVRAKITPDKKVFVNSSNLENFLDDMSLGPIFGLILGEDFYRQMVSGIDEGWWEIDDETTSLLFGLEDSENEAEKVKISSCLSEKTKDFSLKNAKFLSATAVEDKDRTFEVHIDSDELANFVYEPITCFSNIEQKDLSENLAAYIGEFPKIFVDVDDTNNFSRIYFDDETSEYASSTVINLEYAGGKAFETPDNYAPFSDLLEYYQQSQKINIELN